MSTLLELSKSVEDIFEEIEGYEAESIEVPMSLQEMVSTLLTEQAEKIDKCAQFVNYTETQIEFLKNEKAVIDAHIKRLEARILRMKSLAEMVMTKQNTKKLVGLKGHTFTARVTKSCVVEKEDHLLPSEFVRINTVYNADKSAIKKALETGQKIDGCKIVEKISISVD